MHDARMRLATSLAYSCATRTGEPRSVTTRATQKAHPAQLWDASSAADDKYLASSRAATKSCEDSPGLKKPADLGFRLR